MKVESFLEVFRENAREIPEVAAAWFQLPNPSQELMDKLGLQEMIRRLTANEPLDPHPELAPRNLSPEARTLIDGSKPELASLLVAGNYQDAYRVTNARLTTIEDTLQGNDQTGAKIAILHNRAVIPGHMVEHGILKARPTGDKIRALAVLSEATDLMRADIAYGGVTDKGKTISECFGYAQMGILQQAAVTKIYGEGTPVIFESGQRVRGASAPADQEIRRIQRQIMAKVAPHI